ncbi:hypothetical protein BGZ54_002142 [Gamsiella multidivaricata]|nr:hypothetical protein BGZ54_002142 [Gamsiella multidivaricata]
MAAPQPHPSTDILSVTSPKFNSVYKVGHKVPVKISIVNGTKSEFYKKNPKVELYLQKNIHLPLLNVHLGSVRARTLHKDGFEFKVKAKYLIKEQSNVPFRVRASFDLGARSGFVDSPSFKLVK